MSPIERGPQPPEDYEKTLERLNALKERAPKLPEDYQETLERLNTLWQSRSPEYPALHDQYSLWARREGEDDIERAERHVDWSTAHFGRLMHEHDELKKSETP